MKNVLSTLAVVVALASGCGEDDDDVQRYSAELQPVNDSGVHGRARLALAGDRLTAEIDADGLEHDRIHEQAIQGYEVSPGRDADCPAQGGDEGALVGSTIRTLEPYPTVRGDGEIDWKLTLTVDPRELQPLESRVIVLKGMGGDDPARYLPNRPVACGEVEPAGSAE